MHDILNSIEIFRQRLRNIVEKNEDYTVEFIIAMEERIHLLLTIEEKINSLKNETIWLTEETRRIAIEESYNQAKNALDEAYDPFFMRRITTLTIEIKNLINRMQNKDTLLFATGMPNLTNQLKSQIHQYDFLDEELFYPETLILSIEQKRPSVVVITEFFGDITDTILPISITYDEVRFILMGDRFVKMQELHYLPNIKVFSSKVKKMENLID